MDVVFASPIFFFRRLRPDLLSGVDGISTTGLGALTRKPADCRRLAVELDPPADFKRLLGGVGDAEAPRRSDTLPEGVPRKVSKAFRYSDISSCCD